MVKASLLGIYVLKTQMISLIGGRSFHALHANAIAPAVLEILVCCIASHAKVQMVYVGLI